MACESEDHHVRVRELRGHLGPRGHRSADAQLDERQDLQGTFAVLASPRGVHRGVLGGDVGPFLGPPRRHELVAVGLESLHGCGHGIGLRRVRDRDVHIARSRLVPVARALPGDARRADSLAVACGPLLDQVVDLFGRHLQERRQRLLHHLLLLQHRRRTAVRRHGARGQRVVVRHRVRNGRRSRILRQQLQRLLERRRRALRADGSQQLVCHRRGSRGGPRLAVLPRLDVLHLLLPAHPHRHPQRPRDVGGGELRAHGGSRGQRGEQGERRRDVRGEPPRDGREDLRAVLGRGRAHRAGQRGDP
mmetsp:Transcript_3164/g.9099  ORF Transcript_3164/g.9099 Transcript_3164/m.9099 type:complete len:305 (+) Transcript_3164:1143-2057(+)